MSTKMFVFVAIALHSVALLLQILGVALPLWTVSQGNGGEVETGLWQVCHVFMDERHCLGFSGSQMPGFITTTRVMELIALVLMFAVIIILFLQICVSRYKDVLILIGTGTTFTAGVFALIGTIIFGVKFDAIASSMELPLVKLGSGFILCIVSPILSFLVGGILIGLKVRQTRETRGFHFQNF